MAVHEMKQVCGRAWRSCVLARGCVRDTDNAWRLMLVRQKLQPMRGGTCEVAVLGWVLLGIGCSITLCLYFDSWMSRTMRSESCRDCGRDGSDSLLTVTTG